jgi:hypothetical protein
MFIAVRTYLKYVHSIKKIFQNNFKHRIVVIVVLLKNVTVPDLFASCHCCQYSKVLLPWGVVFGVTLESKGTGLFGSVFCYNLSVAVNLLSDILKILNLCYGI